MQRSFMDMALEKARASQAAKREALLSDKRKIIATEKGKVKIAKDGPDDMLARMVKAKTLGNALSEHEDIGMKDINYAVRVGLIELS